MSVGPSPSPSPRVAPARCNQAPPPSGLWGYGQRCQGPNSCSERALPTSDPLPQGCPLESRLNSPTPACSSPVPLLSVPVHPPKGQTQTRTEPHVLFKPKLLGTPELFQPDSEAQPHGPPLLGCAVFKCPGCALPALQSTPQTEPPGASEQQPGPPPPPLLPLPPQGASLWLLLSGSWELGKTESGRREKTERGGWWLRGQDSSWGEGCLGWN